MSNQEQKRKKLVIFSVSAGAGHVRAAQALVAATKQCYPLVDAVHIDLMDHVPQLFRKVYADSYLKVVESHPALWGYLYDKSDHDKPNSGLNRLRRAIERLSTASLGKLLRELEPDHIICTHFLPAELLARKIRNGKLNVPVWVQVTDFDLHALWVQQQMSGYFAANEELAGRMAERGIPAETIHVTGIPIMPVFERNYDRATCAAEFGLDPKRTTLLMMSGGMGVGGIEQLAERLLQVPGDFQIVALAGRNDTLLTNLKLVAMRHPGRLIPLGFTNVIERVMAASDLAITKPGGLTTSECLAVGLPMIVVSPIPGQEERNADFLLENGAALKACDAGALVWRVQHLLQHPERLAELSDKAQRQGRPDAARKVLATVLGEAQQL
ncbi:MAG: hypothetical protein OEL57_11980 [Trichlorobacter sp.]|uniref:MGDG synthase family glycosyltransferase n=1 Tax=Trichlorobacter sp. TaxID=2911007 RepID=UPI00255F8500|nr:glycosyltransferase [Trichlorobacter sp.]MDK9718605.1 hypothetical protein [Trichlorobacter sp.]